MSEQPGMRTSEDDPQAAPHTSLRTEVEIAQRLVLALMAELRAVPGFGDEFPGRVLRRAADPESGALGPAPREEVRKKIELLMRGFPRIQ